MPEETVNGKIRILLKSMSDAMMEAVEKIEEETMTKNDLRDLHDDIINDLEEINYLTEGYKE
jgi:hypothetical protein